MREYIKTRKRTTCKSLCWSSGWQQCTLSSLLSRFGNFFNHVDNFASEAFLFVTSDGIPATKHSVEKKRDKDDSVDVALGSEAEDEDLRSGEGLEG